MSALARADLPPPVARFVERNVPPGTLPARVSFAQAGQMQLKPGRWLRFEAEQEAATEQVEFSWRARFPIAPLVALRVDDWYRARGRRARSQAVRPAAQVFSSSIRPASSTATAVSEYLCTSTPITIIQIASSTVGGDRRADTPQSRQLPSSYQVTLGGLGRRRRHNAGKSTFGATCGNRVSRRRASLRRSPDATTTSRMTLSAGMMLL
jgi:hypothetical protein